MDGIRSTRFFALALVFTLAMAAPRPAAAAILTVTDCGDTTPGGVPGQLRRAINDAQSTGDVILLPACTITLTGAPNEDSNAGGDLDIAKNLGIQGAGPGRTIIRAASSSATPIRCLAPCRTTVVRR
jgi:hypothetical protein